LATTRKRAPKSAPATTESTQATPPLDMGLFKFDVGNEPNADILLPSLRATGYTLETAIGDWFDNSVDENATNIAVNLSKDSSGEWTIEIADDGNGMDEQTLDQMMRLGSRSEHDLEKDLGAFGLGSDTAALALGRRKHVVTCPEPGVYLSAMWDLDVIIEQRRFVKHLGHALPEEIALYHAAFERAKLAVPEIGTVVRISKCERVGRSMVDPAVRSVTKYVGQTYRRFLAPNGSVTGRVNGNEVGPIDPMWRDHKDTTVLLDEREEFVWTDGEGNKRTDTFGVLVVHLPDFGGKEANKAQGITPDSSGFYVLRNGREIVEHTTLGMYVPHAEWARFRCELSFPATLDSELGVQFLKSTVEIKPSQALRDKIKQAVEPYRRQSRTMLLKSRPKADAEQVPHEAAAKHIKSQSSLLRKPLAEQEVRQPGDTKADGGPKQAQDTKPGDAPQPRQRTHRTLADEAEFRAEHAGRHAPFYEGMIIGKKIVVIYNADHPAYERLILENRENLGQIAAIDYLVWSLAAAEQRNVSEEHVSFMDSLREDASFNLRQLLSA
jgi:hypothetical protein